MKSPSIGQLAVDMITESPLNPRKTYGDLTEITESVRTHGILSPVLVRPLPRDPLKPDAEPCYQLVYGHRRLRAAKAAELEKIPALIRVLDDRQCLEIQVIENLQREDVHPLEEADGYKALHEIHGYSADLIAEKTGKSKAYIYGRMKLCVLAKAGRKAFYDGEISASVALLISRIPDAKLQADAVRDFGNENGGESARWVGEQIQRNYMHRLKQAPFKMDDAELLAKAGACSGCPKLTGNQSELFSDVGAADFCTDPKCYQLKLGAHWKVVSKKAKKDGIRVLDQKESKKLWPYGTTSQLYGSNYVALSETCWEDKKHRTYGKILGSSPEGFVLAQHPAGQPAKLFPKKGLQSALREAGLKVQPRGTSRAPSAADKKSQTQQRNEREASRRTVAAIVEASRGGAKSARPDLLRTIVKASSSQLWDDARKVILDRRGVEKDESHLGSQVALDHLADQLTGPDLWALLVEIAITPDSMNNYDMGDILKSAAALHDVDQVAILKEVRAEHQAKEKAKKKKKTAKKKATKKVGKSTKKVGKKAAKKPAAAEACSAAGCSNPTKTRGLCSAHYQKHRRLVQEGKPGLIK